MCNNWLKAPDQSIDARRVEEEVRQRLDGLYRDESVTPVSELELLVDTLRRQMIQGSERSEFALAQQDCDIVPRDYAIDWRLPILGPIHALVRRLINAEIRRYLWSALEKQSYLNRQFLRTLNDLREENECLRCTIEELQGHDRESPGR